MAEAQVGVERHVLLPGGRLDGGDDLPGDAQLGEAAEGGVAAVLVVADGLVQADIALLDQVVAVAAGQEVGIGLQPHELAVAHQDRLVASGSPALANATSSSSLGSSPGLSASLPASAALSIASPSRSAVAGQASTPASAAAAIPGLASRCQLVPQRLEPVHRTRVDPVLDPMTHCNAIWRNCNPFCVFLQVARELPRERRITLGRKMVCWSW